MNKNRKKLLCTFAIIGIILPLHSPYSHAQEIINSKEEILFITSYNSDSKHTYDNINSCITTYQKLGGTCPAVVENMNAISLEHAWRWPKIVKNIIDKHPKVSLIILLGGEAWSGYFSLEEEEYKKSIEIGPRAIVVLLGRQEAEKDAIMAPVAALQDHHEA